jgi:hypothetical protein
MTSQLGWHPQPEDLTGRRGEPGGREGHGQRLVRPVSVVFCPPPIHRSLRLLDASERPGRDELGTPPRLGWSSPLSTW